jgi:hypothetical protein
MNWTSRWPGAVVALAVAGLGGGNAVHGQKGIGEAEGIARQTAKPVLQSLSGDLLSVETHPCGQTTGRSPLGTHLRLRTQDQVEINLHLGPSEAVAPMIRGLEPGQHVEVEAFRTPDMPENAYVAQRIRVGEMNAEFRDAVSLRPSWAIRPAGRSDGQGRGAGPGMGQGIGMGKKMRDQGWARGVGQGSSKGQGTEPGVGTPNSGYGPCWW